ncbi:MAG: hypothetical protein HYX72_02470 [Acidobacteria bacterium]|nr:hypothetical protein [Acidobacteriota bacterium]
MLGPDQKIIWTYLLDAPITAQPVYRADRNEIAIIGFDLTFQRLNADIGRSFWRANVNGRATFADIRPYKKGYLVKSNMGAYREMAITAEEREAPDSLAYWGQTEDDYWSVDFPIGAELAVSGDHIYAVMPGQNSVRVQNITPPPGKR